jgi:Na+/pantothenate symporter
MTQVTCERRIIAQIYTCTVNLLCLLFTFVELLAPRNIILMDLFAFSVSSLLFLCFFSLESQYIENKEEKPACMKNSQVSDYKLV